MGKKRKHKETSSAAHDSVKQFKSELYAKILAGLEKLKVGGNFYEISLAANLKPEQVWKRLSELVDAGKIFDTGITRKLPSKRKGIVWQITGMKVSDETPIVAKPSKKKIEQVYNPLFNI